MIFDTNDKKILLAYKGPFCIDILANLAKYIKHHLSKYPETSSKLYKIFFELAQNVAKYSAEKDDINNCKFSGIGSFHLVEDNDKYYMTTSNLILRSHGEVLLKYCDEVNAMTRDDLKNFKSFKLNQQTSIHDIGAHIGIVQVGLFTMNKVICSVENVDDTYAMYSITAVIDKD